jgi:4-hydroxy-4-methyl-2-oxoglutarate aldolase
MNTEEKNTFLSSIQTGVITDAMGLLGLEGWMEDIFPANKSSRLFGRAVTVQCTPVRDKDERTYSFYEIVDMCQPGDIIVVDGMGTTGRLMGDNMAHAAYYKGIGGIVLNGRVRDFGDISAIDMPIFSKGPAMRPVTHELKYTAVNVPIICAGAKVLPGDYIMGDIDGVLVFPADRVDDIIYQAKMILEVEKEMKKALRDRVPLEKLLEIGKKKKRPRQ